MARLASTRGGSGEPLLLIHGLGSSRTIWDRARPLLERDFDVIAVDLPGFGDEPWPDGVEPTMDALATAVESELDALGIERPIVAGNSMGGWIAIELGRRGRAREVIAMAPVGGDTPAEARTMKRRLRVNRMASRALAPVSAVALRSKLARRIGFRDVATAEVPYDDAVSAAGHMAASQGFPELLGDVAGPGALIETNRRRFAQVRCPVLVVFGSEDRIVAELAAVQGKPADIGGYYLPNAQKCEAVMRPSATFNAALAQMSEGVKAA